MILLPIVIFYYVTTPISLASLDEISYKENINIHDIIIEEILPNFNIRAFHITNTNKADSDKINIELEGVLIPESYKSEAEAVIKDYLGKAKAHIGPKKTNRNGNYLAHIYKENGSWLQEELLEKGLAYIYPITANDLYLEQMQKAENNARKKKLAIWNSSKFKIFNAEDVESILNQKNKFTLVTGQIFAVKKFGDDIYINFTQDWKKDFTIIIKSENISSFSFEELKNLEGKIILARGWVESYNGALIRVYNKGHLSVLDADNVTNE